MRWDGQNGAGSVVFLSAALGFAVASHRPPAKQSSRHSCSKRVRLFFFSSANEVCGIRRIPPAIGGFDGDCHQCRFCARASERSVCFPTRLLRRLHLSARRACCIALSRSSRVLVANIFCCLGSTAVCLLEVFVCARETFFLSLRPKGRSIGRDRSAGLGAVSVVVSRAALSPSLFTVSHWWFLSTRSCLSLSVFSVFILAGTPHEIPANRSMRDR